MYSADVISARLLHLRISPDALIASPFARPTRAATSLLKNRSAAFTSVLCTSELGSNEEREAGLGLQY